MWLLYRHTGDATGARKQSIIRGWLKHRKNDRNVHDLGFVFWSTWKRWYDLTGDEALNEVVIQAGQDDGHAL